MVLAVVQVKVLSSGQIYHPHGKRISDDKGKIGGVEKNEQNPSKGLRSHL